MDVKTLMERTSLPFLFLWLFCLYEQLFSPLFPYLIVNVIFPLPFCEKEKCWWNSDMTQQKCVTLVYFAFHQDKVSWWWMRKCSMKLLSRRDDMLKHMCSENNWSGFHGNGARSLTPFALCAELQIKIIFLFVEEEWRVIVSQEVMWWAVCGFYDEEVDVV